MSKTIEQIAHELAVDAKASGIHDFGCLHHEDDHGHLTDSEWATVCKMADAALPTVRVPREVAAGWAEADRAVRAEARAETLALCPH